MEENEDEPDDVKNATPVANDIKSGRKDERGGNTKSKNKKRDDSGGTKSSRCEKEDKPVLVKLEADRCHARIAKPSKASKTMSVLIYSPPCNLPRLEIIPRHCLSKKEYIDILASPSRKCPSSCSGKTVIRKVRPISARINELAQPARRLIVGTLQERGETLPPEMISNLVKSIEGSTCMTPEQAENYFRDKGRAKERKSGKCARQKCKEKIKNSCPSGLDKEAVMCQYLMAERFVKSILQWKCPIPVEEFQDIANVILRRLSFILEYKPLDEQEDLKSQQMRFLADIVACWISGVLFEVAEEHKKELKEEEELQTDEGLEDEESDEDEEEQPDKSGKEVKEEDEEEEEEEEEEKEAEGKVGEDKDKDGSAVPEDLGSDAKEESETDKEPDETVKSESESETPNASDEVSDSPVIVKPEPLEPVDTVDETKLKQEIAEEEKKRKEAEEKANKEAEEKARLEEEIRKKEEEEKEKARQEAEEKARLEEENRKKEEEEKARQDAEEEEKKKKKKEMEEAAEKARLEEEEEKKKKKQREDEEAEEKKKKEAEEKKKQAEEEEKNKKKEEEKKLMEMGPGNAIDGIGEGNLFKTDLPFVTFGKILDTIYDMLEDEPEGDETDIIHNRIQRALYEKLSRLVELESPDSLTENLKDVIDVTSGKIASWLKNVLKDTEAKFMATQPAEVESKEIRDWGRWIDQVTDRAVDWADWIHRVVQEAEGKCKEPVNRGDWQNWTGETDTKALLWRRYYLETIHQAHHNKMMMAERALVKTGQKGDHSTVANIAEEEIRNTDLVA